jgi:hypothetical protein
MTISRRILLRMWKVVEKIITHILCSMTFSRKPCRLWDNVEKCCRAREAADDSVTRRMRFACRISKATHARTPKEIRNIYWFCTGVMVSWTRLSVTLLMWSLNFNITSWSCSRSKRFLIGYTACPGFDQRPTVMCVTLMPTFILVGPLSHALISAFRFKPFSIPWIYTFLLAATLIMFLPLAILMTQLVSKFGCRVCVTFLYTTVQICTAIPQLLC